MSSVHQKPDRDRKGSRWRFRRPIPQPRSRPEPGAHPRNGNAPDLRPQSCIGGNPLHRPEHGVRVEPGDGAQPPVAARHLMAHAARLPHRRGRAGSAAPRAGGLTDSCVPPPKVTSLAEFCPAARGPTVMRFHLPSGAATRARAVAGWLAAARLRVPTVGLSTAIHPRHRGQRRTPAALAGTQLTLIRVYALIRA